MNLDSRNRASAFSALEENEFDVLVIDAGITGVGIARDAAMRGLSVAPVDANDYGAGISRSDPRNSCMVACAMGHKGTCTSCVKRPGNGRRSVVLRPILPSPCPWPARPIQRWFS